VDPDLLLLDVMLPRRDGFDVCREVRKRSAVPIVMLTARDDVIDRVSGLELGADDYVCKPFEPRELVARIQTVLRRVGTRRGQPRLAFQGLEIDLESRTVLVDGAPVELTSMEFELLSVLARHAGRKMSRDEILVQLRGVDAALLTRSVDIAVSRLRQKIGDSGKPARFIQTVWGRGYVFVGRPVGADA
jgi:DNA-binding response OmpR family regulator